MSDFYQEYGLETEPTPSFSYKPEKKKGGWLGRIIALLLGLVIGIGACVGAVCAILFSPASTPLSLMGMSQADQEKLISRDYLDDSILSIVSALSIASQEGTIAAYDNISPAIGSTIREFADKLKDEMGIDLNENNQLIDSKISDLPSTLSTSVKATPVGKILRASNENEKLEPMLMEICYGIEGKDYVLDEDGEPVMLGASKATTLTMLSSDPTAVMNRVTVASVIKPEPEDTRLLAIAYGQRDITYELEVDAKGNYVREEDGRLKVTMLPMFIEMDKSGAFVDHNGKTLQCETTPAENGFTKIKQFKADADNKIVVDNNGNPIVKSVYYVLYDEESERYYAYERANTDSEPVYFEKTVIGDMTENNGDAILDDLLLCDVLTFDFSSGEEPNGVLVSLAYGEEGTDFEYIRDKNDKITGIDPINNPRTVGQLNSRGEDLINDIPLNKILNEDRNDAIIMYLLYGKPGLHYDINPTTDEVDMYPMFIGITEDEQVYNEYGEKLDEQYGAEGDKDYINGYVLDTTEKTFTDRRGNFYHYELADGAPLLETEDGKKIARYYLYDEDGKQVDFPKTSLGDLAYSDNPIANLTKHMTVVEVLGEENIKGNKFLKHVANNTIDELPKAIDELTFAQVFETDIFLGNRYQPTEDEPKSYIDANGKEVHEGDFIDENGNFVPMEDREMKGIWKYLLHQGEDEITGEPIYHYEYKVTTEMNVMLDNMTDNIQHATLNDLEKDGIMDFDEAMLETKIKTSHKGLPILDKNGQPLNYEGKTYLGDLTVLEMLDYTSAILAVIE